LPEGEFAAMLQEKIRKPRPPGGTEAAGNEVLWNCGKRKAGMDGSFKSCPEAAAETVLFY